MIKSLKQLLSGAFSNTAVKRGNHRLHKESNIQESCRLTGPFCLPSVRGERSMLGETWGISTPFLKCSKVIHPEMYRKPPNTVSRQSWDTAGLHRPIPSTGSLPLSSSSSRQHLPSGWKPSGPSQQQTQPCAFLASSLFDSSFSKELWNYSCWEYESESHTGKQAWLRDLCGSGQTLHFSSVRNWSQEGNKQFISPGRTRDGSSGPCEQLAL